MPIYEYRAIKNGCAYCKKGFDTIQKMSEKPLTTCPKCGAKVRKAVSSFRACVVETPEDVTSVESELRNYEEDVPEPTTATEARRKNVKAELSGLS